MTRLKPNKSHDRSTETPRPCVARTGDASGGYPPKPPLVEKDEKDEDFLKSQSSSHLRRSLESITQIADRSPVPVPMV